MNRIQKHIGRIKNTGTSCVVVFLEVPDEEDCCLVVETDSLPPKYRDSFIDMVNTEGQRNHDLSLVLSRGQFPTGENMLRALHDNEYLKKVKTDNVVMFTIGSNTMPLVHIVNEIRKANGKDPLPAEPMPTDVTGEMVDKVFDGQEEKELANPQELDPKDQAKNLLTQAEILEEDAKRLKNEAYELDPSLKPKRKRKTPPKKDDA